jgi:hypothetical protein
VEKFDVEVDMVTNDQEAVQTAQTLARDTLVTLYDQLEAGADRQWLLERAMYRLSAIDELLTGARPQGEVLAELEMQPKAWS